MSRILLVCAVVLALLATFIPADAANPPIPFSIDTCASGNTGHTISAAGSYKLTASVLDCAASPLISIEASNVVVNLNSMMLDGDDTFCAAAIVVSGTRSKVTVKNGTVRDCASGVNLSSATKSTISAVNIRSTGEQLGTAATIGNFSTFKGNTLVGNKNGALLAGSSDVITRNTFDKNGDAVFEYTLVAGSSNVITKNTFTRNIDDAMFVSGNSNVFKQNIAIGNDGDGICIDGDKNIITKNTAIGNAEAGIEVTGESNIITLNTAKSNGDAGIIAGEKGSVVSKNKAIGNEAHGIEIEDSTNTTIVHVTVTSNVASGNLGHGIRLVDPIDDSSFATVVKKNTANGNGEKGITTNAPPDPLGAKTNHATGNVNATQCDSFLC